MWLMTSACPSLFLETLTGAWDRPRVDKYNFCSKTLEITLQENTLYRACDMLTWLKPTSKSRSSPAWWPDIPMNRQYQRVCDIWPGALSSPSGVPGMAGTHRILEVAQTPMARWEDWSPRGYWHWLWTDKDSQDWGLRWRGKCPRSKLPTAARSGNLVHNFGGEGRRESQRDIVPKTFSKNKKGKLMHSIQGTVLVTVVLDSDSLQANRGRFGFNFLYDWIYHEGCGSSWLIDSVHFKCAHVKVERYNHIDFMEEHEANF